jgi:hypothetical protein
VVPDDVEKRKLLTVPGFEFRLLGFPARSQSLYRLGYSGSEDFRQTLVNTWWEKKRFPIASEVPTLTINSNDN